MGSYWLALVGVAVTQAVNIGIMWAKGRRQAKGDRISDLQAAQNTRFEDMNRRFDEARADSDKKHDALLALIAAWGQETKALGDDVKGLEIKLTGEIKALEIKFTDRFTSEIKGLEIKLTEKFNCGLGDLRKEMHEGFRDPGERLARIETRLEFNHPDPDPDHTPADTEAAVLPGPGRS